MTRFAEVQNAYSFLYEEPVTAEQFAPIKAGFAGAWWAMTTPCRRVYAH